MENNPISTQKKHTVIMFPMPLGSLSSQSLLHKEFLDHLNTVKHWVAENARTFRRFVASLNLGINIDELQIFELYREYDKVALSVFLQKSLKKGDVGVVSEAGMPGMADPGAEVAAWAHQHEIAVKVISGPSSIILALSGSGLNGQQFTFHGYAPVKEPELKQFLSQIGKDINRFGYTHAFIEVPYRSDRFFQTLLSSMTANTRLCLACNLHEEDEFIQTKSIAEWSEYPIVIGKKPCIFLVGK
jgi:16S rRNA (cytidine1402-2'-O)-methyltransferase